MPINVTALAASLSTNLSSLQASVGGLLGEIAGSEIAQAIKNSTKGTGLLSGHWNGTEIEEGKHKLYQEGVSAILARDEGFDQKQQATMAEIQKLTAKIYGSNMLLGGIDIISKYLVAPIINTTIRLIKATCTLIKTAATKIKNNAPVLANAIKRELTKAAENTKTACKEAYNTAKVRYEELGAKLERHRAGSKGVRSLLAAGVARTFGKNTPEGRKTLRDIDKADQRNREEAERKYQYRLEQIAKNEDVRAAALNIKGGKAQKHGHHVGADLKAKLMDEIKNNPPKLKKVTPKGKGH